MFLSRVWSLNHSTQCTSTRVVYCQMYFWSWCSKGDEKSLGVQKRLSGRVQVVPVCFHVIVSNTWPFCWIIVGSSIEKKKHSSLWGFFCSYCWHAFITTSDHCWTQVVFEEREGKKGAPDVCGGPPARKRSWYIYSELEGQPRGHFIPFFLTGWPLYHVLSTGRASKRALSPKMEHKPVTLTLGQSALR